MNPVDSKVLINTLQSLPELNQYAACILAAREILHRNKPKQLVQLQAVLEKLVARHDSLEQDPSPTNRFIQDKLLADFMSNSAKTNLTEAITNLLNRRKILRFEQNHLSEHLGVKSNLKQKIHEIPEGILSLINAGNSDEEIEKIVIDNLISDLNRNAIQFHGYSNTVVLGVLEIPQDNLDYPTLMLNVKKFVREKPQFKNIMQYYYQTLISAGLDQQISHVMKSKYSCDFERKPIVIDTTKDGELLLKLSFKVKTKPNQIGRNEVIPHDFFDQGAIDIDLVLENAQWQVKSILADNSLLALASFRQEFSDEEIKFLEVFTAVRNKDFEASPDQLMKLAKLGAQIQDELQKAIEAKIKLNQPIKEIQLEKFECYKKFHSIVHTAELKKLIELKSDLLKRIEALKNKTTLSPEAISAIEKKVNDLYETAHKTMLSEPYHTAKTCKQFTLLDQLKGIFDDENTLQSNLKSLTTATNANKITISSIYDKVNDRKNKALETKLSELSRLKDSASSDAKDSTSEKVINALYTHLKDQLIAHKSTVLSFKIENQPTYRHLEKLKEILVLEKEIISSLSELLSQPGNELYCEAVKNAQAAFSKDLHTLFLNSVEKPADFSMVKVNYLSNQLQNLNATTEALKNCKVGTNDKTACQTKLKTQLQKQIKEAKEEVSGWEKFGRLVEEVAKTAALAALGAAAGFVAGLLLTGGVAAIPLAVAGAFIGGGAAATYQSSLTFFEKTKAENLQQCVAKQAGAIVREVNHPSCA